MFWMSDRVERVFFPASICLLWLLLFAPALFGASIWISEVYAIETFTEYFPFKDFIRHSYLSGFFPLWTHNDECGFPFFAHPHTGSFYPLNLFFVLMNYVPALNWYSFIHVLFLSYCGYFCGRELSFNRFSSWVSGMAFGLSGTPIFTAGAVAPFTHNCWVPAIYLAALRLARKQSFGNFLFLTCCSFFQALASEPEMVLYQAVYLLVVVWAFKRASGKGLACLILAIGLSWLMATAQFLPTVDLIFHSFRRLTSASMLMPASPQNLILALNLLTPFFVPVAKALFPSPLYLGFLLFPGWYFAARNSSTSRGFYAMAGVGILVMVYIANPWPLNQWGAVGFIAPDSRFKAVEPFEFWMLLAAGAGIDFLTCPPFTATRIRSMRNIIFGFGLLALAVASIMLLLHSRYPQLAAIFLAPHRLVFALSALLVGFLLLIIGPRHTLADSALMPLLTFIFLADLLGVALAFRPHQEIGPFKTTLPGEEFLLQQNPTAHYRYATLYSTYVPLLDPRIVKYHNLYRGPGFVYSFIRVGLETSTPLLVASAEGGSNLGILNINAEKKPLMDRLGIKYILSDATAFWGSNPFSLNIDSKGFRQRLSLKPGAVRKISAQFFPGDRMVFGAWTSGGVFEPSQLKIFYSSRGQTRELAVSRQDSFWTATLEVAKQEDGELVFELAPGRTSPVELFHASIQNQQRPFHLIYDQEIKIYENRGAWPKYFLTKAGAEYPDPEAEPPKLERYDSQQIRLRTRLSSPATLHIIESYYPGWQAWVNGKEQRILRAEGFQELDVFQGESSVDLAFAPMDFEIGLWCSLASLVALAVMLLVFGMRLRYLQERR